MYNPFVNFYRILAVIILLVCAVAVPQAATAAAAVAAAFFFPRFWEALAIGVLLDALYSTPEPHWFGFQFIYTVGIALALVVVWRLKQQIIWYSRN